MGKRVATEKVLSFMNMFVVFYFCVFSPLDFHPFQIIFVEETELNKAID